jgi:hypothetical protein
MKCLHYPTETQLKAPFQWNLVRFNHSITASLALGLVGEKPQQDIASFAQGELSHGLQNQGRENFCLLEKKQGFVSKNLKKKSIAASLLASTLSPASVALLRPCLRRLSIPLIVKGSSHVGTQFYGF